MTIITFATIGENANEFHSGFWTAESDIKIPAPHSLCDMDLYIEGQGKTEQDAIESLMLNLKARGINGVLRRRH